MHKEKLMKDHPVILIVDDNLQNIELMQAYLEPKGYKTVTATGGQQALDILANQPIDLILLDIMMPGMNGFEVTRRVRGDALLKLLPSTYSEKNSSETSLTPSEVVPLTVVD